jgi:hypothetical protein
VSANGKARRDYNRAIDVWIGGSVGTPVRVAATIDFTDVDVRDRHSFDVILAKLNSCRYARCDVCFLLPGVANVLRIRVQMAGRANHAESYLRRGEQPG